MTPFHSVRTLAFRPRATPAFRQARAIIGVKRRAFADEPPFANQNALHKAEEGDAGPNMAQAEHVSEEAAKMSKIMGTGEGPDMEQGTPVQDVRIPPPCIDVDIGGHIDGHINGWSAN